MKRIPLIIAILILAATGVTAWWLIGRKPPQIDAERALTQIPA
jgi:hypothetical protein